MLTLLQLQDLGFSWDAFPLDFSDIQTWTEPEP